MPTEQYNPLAGGRGLGRSRLLSDMAREESFETKRYEDELRLAEEAAREESEGASAYQSIGSTAAALFTFLTTKDPKKTLEAWTWGGEAGKWGHRLLSGYDPEDYPISTDMGKFKVQDKYKVADVYQQFIDRDRSRLYQDFSSTGKALGTLAYLGSDLGNIFGDKTGSQILGEYGSGLGI